MRVHPPAVATPRRAAIPTWARYGAVTLLCTIAAMSATAVARAAADPFLWSAGIPLDVSGGTNGLLAVACPSTSQCTAVDQNGQEVTFNPASPSRARPVTVDPGGTLTSISCPSASECIAADVNGFAITFDPGAPGGATRVRLESLAAIAAVSCPTTTQCTAADSADREITFNPVGSGTPSIAQIATGAITGLACPATSQCTATTADSKVITFDPATPAGASSTAFSGGLPASIACPSTTRCVAISTAGATTFDPATPATHTTIALTGVPTSVACATVSQCTVTTSAGSEATFDPGGTSISSQAKLLPAGAPQFNPNDLACPSATQCTAVDQVGKEGTFNPTASTAAIRVTLDAVTFPDSIACPLPGRCVAVDTNGRELTFDPTVVAGAIPAPVAVDQGGQPAAVACPSATQCTAVDNLGQEVTFDPTAPAVQTSAQFVASAPLDAVACTSVSQCTAVDQIGQAVTFDPGAPAGATVTSIDSHFLSGVACPSSGQCTASEENGAVVTFDPAAPGGAVRTVVEAGGSLAAIACPSTSQCTVVDATGHEVTFNPATPGTPPAAPIDAAANSLDQVSCPSVSQCTAVDIVGNEITFDPTTPAPQATPVEIPGANGLETVACPAVDECVTLDFTGVGFAGFGAPVSVAPPAIVGTPNVGVMLSATPGRWTGTAIAFTYQWLGCDASGNACAPIPGASTLTFTPTADLGGRTLRLKETATNPGGSRSIISAATARVAAHVPPVSVTTTKATGVTTTRAILHGVIQTRGVAVNWRFQFGTGGTLTRSTHLETIAAGHGTVNVSTSVSNLQPNTTYRFRLVGQTTSAGRTVSVQGGHLSLKTAPTGSVGLPQSTLRVTRSTTSIAVRCISARRCGGRLRLTTASNRAGRGAVPCGSVAFELRPGQRRLFVVRLTSACRTLLARSRRHTITVRLVATSDTGQRGSSRTLTLHN